MRRRRWLATAFGLLVVIGLPVLGHLYRRAGPIGCALDGMPIEPIYRVRVLDHGRQTHEFCCLRCAELWLLRQPERPRAVLVTDEAGGAEIAAADAHYVRSLVVTTPTTGNRIHVFRRLEDAKRHAASAAGTLLFGDDRPFQGK